MLIKEATSARQGPNMSLALTTGGLIIYCTHTHLECAVQLWVSVGNRVRWDMMLAGFFKVSTHHCHSINRSQPTQPLWMTRSARWMSSVETIASPLTSGELVGCFDKWERTDCHAVATVNRSVTVAGWYTYKHNLSQYRLSRRRWRQMIALMTVCEPHFNRRDACASD